MAVARDEDGQTTPVIRHSPKRAKTTTTSATTKTPTKRQRRRRIFVFSVGDGGVRVGARVRQQSSSSLRCRHRRCSYCPSCRSNCCCRVGRHFGHRRQTARVSTSRLRPNRCAGCCWNGRSHRFRLHRRCRRHSSSISAASGPTRMAADIVWMRSRCARATAADGRCGRLTWPVRSSVVAWPSWLCSVGPPPRPSMNRSRPAVSAARPVNHVLAMRSV